MTPVRLKPAAPRSRVKHSTTKPLRSLLKHLISKMEFTAVKYSGQDSFTVKKGTIDKLLFLLKTIGIYP